MIADPKKDMLLFDLDGTLWDSAVNVAASWNIVIRKYAPSLPALTAGDIHGIMGMTMTEIASVLHPSAPWTAEERTRIFEECSRFEVDYLNIHGGDVYPGVRDVMSQLREDGFTLGIVSNCQCGYVRSFLLSSGCADLVTDWEEWERTGKSKGENIRLVMDRNGFDRAIYIGDTAKDQEAALLAGIPFIHASYGFGEAIAPDGVIRVLTELPGLLKRLFTT